MSKGVWAKWQLRIRIQPPAGGNPQADERAVDPRTASDHGVVLSAVTDASAEVPLRLPTARSSISRTLMCVKRQFTSTANIDFWKDSRRPNIGMLPFCGGIMFQKGDIISNNAHPSQPKGNRSCSSCLRRVRERRCGEISFIRLLQYRPNRDKQRLRIYLVNRICYGTKTLAKTK